MNGIKNHQSHEAKVARILDHAKTQTTPMDKNNKKYQEFFEAMAMVWSVADEYNMTKDIPFTNFLMFGPQSVGKTTIVERILGFPVAVVKSGVGTTRPMVLTTRRGEKEEFKVKDADDAAFQPINKQDIMLWVKQQMQVNGKTISAKRVYIEVTGPTYMNRRFVDLPGFQTNDTKDGNRKPILDLLRSELENPDTVIVCVDKAGVDFENSNLVKAFEEIFPGGFAQQPNLTRRFVLAANMLDSWMGEGGLTKSTLVDSLSGYLEGVGLLPIFVGSSVDPQNKDLRDARVDGNDFDFQRIVDEYSAADGREAVLNNDLLSRVGIDNEDFEGCLISKLLSFKALLGTVDAMVVQRDLEKAEQIALKLRQMHDVTIQEISEIENKRKILVGGGGNTLLSATKDTHHTLLDYIHQIATDTPGKNFNAAEAVAASVEWIKKNGNDAHMEELEFVFGTHARNSLKAPAGGQGSPFQGYYNPGLPYKVSGVVVPELLEDTRLSFNQQVFDTVKAVEQARSADIVSLSYLATPLVGGQLYDRAFAVWSSLAYRLVAPSPDDLISLANTVGIDPEMASPDRQDFKKAKRLAGIYIERLIPAIHYLCQKMEFLLLKNFEAAWMVLLRTHKTFVDAVGRKEFKERAKRDFQKAIQKRAEIAFGKCITDLRNEVHKLVPYADSSPSVAGMLLAYPGDPAVGQNVLNTKSKYSAIVKEKFKDIFPSSFKSSLLAGVEYGVELLSTVSGINPLLFGGLHVVAKMLVEGVKHLSKAPGKFKPGEEVLADDRDLRLLGVSACLYSHFLPRFITTIEGRMRADMWSSLGDVAFKRDLEEAFVRSSLIAQAEGKARELRNMQEAHQEKADKICNAHAKLARIVNKFPAPPVERKFGHRPQSGGSHISSTLEEDISSVSDAVNGGERVGSDGTMDILLSEFDGEGKGEEDIAVCATACGLENHYNRRMISVPPSNFVGEDENLTTRYLENDGSSFGDGESTMSSPGKRNRRTVFGRRRDK